MSLHEGRPDSSSVVENYVDAVRVADGSRRLPGPMARLRDAAALDGRGHQRSRAVFSTLAVVVIAVEIVLLAPHLGGAGVALSRLQLSWGLACVGVEIVSMFAFARLQRRMLRTGGVRVPLNRVVAVAFAANAMSVTLPAGSVLSYGFTFRRMRRWGASGPLAAWGLLASGALSTAALAGIGLFGASLAGGRRANVIVVVVEVAASVLAAVSLRRLCRRPALMIRIGRSLLHGVNAILRRPRSTGEGQVSEIVDELTLIKPGARDWLLGLGFAVTNWAADLACLMLACRSVGAHGPSLQVALIAYAAGMAASSLTLLPGGLGLVDGALILALTRGGMPAATATAGVVIYRLVSLVMVAVLGWIAWLIIRRHDIRRRAAMAAAADL